MKVASSRIGIKMTGTRLFLSASWLFLTTLSCQRWVVVAEIAPLDIVSVHRSVASSLLNNCQFDGRITFAGASSLQEDDQYYLIGSRQQLAYELVLDYVNRIRCGIRVDGKNYQIDLKTYDDQSDANVVKTIAQHIAESPKSRFDNDTDANGQNQSPRNTVDVVIGGFSSPMTRPMVDVLTQYNTNISDSMVFHHQDGDEGNRRDDNRERLFVAGGSALTEIFTAKPLAFTTSPAIGTMFGHALRALAEHTTAKTVATIADPLGVAKAACAGVPDLVNELGLTLLREIILESGPTPENLQPVAEEYKEMDPDVVIGCFFTCHEWIDAMRNVNWSPKAQVFSVCIGSNGFASEVGSDAEYMMGASAWYPTVAAVDKLTGWTSEEFDERMRTKSADPVIPYQATTAAAALSIVLQSMEAIQSVANATAIAEYLSKTTFSTMYGNISFDENGQNDAPFLLLQHDSTNDIKIVGPNELANGPVLYPMPTWEGRDCIHLSGCLLRPGFTCSREGFCQCGGIIDNTSGVEFFDINDDIIDSTLYRSVGRGKTARCVLKQEALVGANSVGVSRAVLLSVVAGGLVVSIILLYLYRREKRRKADTTWMVDKKELIFANPPEVIGRGSFGEVLLAEYRGTEVAVKTVVPHTGAEASSTGEERDFSTRTFSESQLVVTPPILSTTQNGTSSWGRMSLTPSDHKFVDGGGTGSWTSSSMRRQGLRETLRLSLRASNVGIGNGNGQQNNAKSGYSRRKMEAMFIEEMRHLSKLRHPCITTVMGAVMSSNQAPMMIMEYMDHGSLYDVLHNETMVFEGEALLNILRDISQGMRFLHASDPVVIHGDLKAANILVDKNFRSKVSDFGLSKTTVESKAAGTPYWMAPELLRDESGNTTSSDVFAYGILTYEVFSRKDPYYGENVEEVVRLVADPVVNKRPPTPPNCPALIEALMSDCQRADPGDRPSFEEVDVRLKRMDIKQVKSAETIVKKTTISMFDIFPRHVAEALQEGRKVDSEHFECVTIFFSDIVGFTTLSSVLTAHQVANLLDRLYTKFDELSTELDVFKVETIGDAYMAVTNLVKSQDDHAVRMANFAAAAIDAANGTLIDENRPEMGHVDIRVGFHSGPVVADVVGSRNPRYCLFGDTVNMASRMESTSKQNCIHCSKRTAELLRKQDHTIRLKARGLVDIKGKGKLETFWVNRYANGDISAFCDTIIATTKRTTLLLDNRGEVFPGLPVVDMMTAPHGDDGGGRGSVHSTTGFPSTLRDAFERMESGISIQA